MDVPRDRDSNHVSGDGGAAALRVRVMWGDGISERNLVLLVEDILNRVEKLEREQRRRTAPDGATAQDLMQEQDWQEEANRVRDGRESLNASPHDYDVSVMARVDRDHIKDRFSNLRDAAYWRNRWSDKNSSQDSLWDDSETE